MHHTHVVASRAPEGDFLRRRSVRMRGVLRFVLAAGVLVAPAVRAVAPAPPSAGQVPSVDRPRAGLADPLEHLREWLSAVARHRPGALDGPATAVASWSHDDLEAVLRELLTLRDELARAHRTNALRVRVPPASARQEGWLARQEVEALLGLTEDEARHGKVNRVLKAGALLHADIGMLRPIPGGPRPASPSSPDRSVLIVIDGQMAGYDDTVVHWGFGRQLLDQVRPDPSQDGAVRLWYHATAVFLLDSSQLAYAEPQLERARQIFDADADILFDSGVLQETYAAARMQGMRGRAKLDLPSEHWRQAERFFRRSVQIDPGVAEARVRLGRVIGLQGRHREAAAALEHGHAGALSPSLQYYAAMFLGDEEQALGHREAAQAHYDRAAQLYPRAQSPRLALGQLARRYGDRPAALRAIAQVLTLPFVRPESDDPWWLYPNQQPEKAAALLADLRRLVSGGERP